MTDKTRIPSMRYERREGIGWEKANSGNHTIPCPTCQGIKDKKEGRKMEKLGIRRQARQLVKRDRRLAAKIRMAMTVGLENETELVESGLVLLLNRALLAGELPTDNDIITSDDYDPDGKGHRWTPSLEGVLLLHLFETRWFHALQRARRNRN